MASNCSAKLVGADNPVASCDQQVFVDEAAEPVSSYDPLTSGDRLLIETFSCV